MEDNKLLNLAIDSLWYLTREEVEFFNNKIALTFAIYSEILANTKNTSKLSDYAKKILLQNIVVTPLVSAKEGIEMATKFNLNDSNLVLDGSMLNIRGMARTRIILGMLKNEVFDRKKNNDIHYAVSTALQKFNLNGTKFQGYSLFEILVGFIKERPQLHDGHEKMVANTFINSNEYSPVINKLNDAFEAYVAKLILQFEQEVKSQGGSRFDYETPMNIYRKISTQLKRYDFNSKTLISSDFVQDIINDYL